MSRNWKVVIAVVAVAFVLSFAVPILAGGGDSRDDHELDRRTFRISRDGPALISAKVLAVTKGEATEADLHQAVVYYIDELRTYRSVTGDDIFVLNELTDKANEVADRCSRCFFTLARQLNKVGAGW